MGLTSNIIKRNKISEVKVWDSFSVNGKDYRIIDGLMVNQLQVKNGTKWEDIANVLDKEDAMNVILGKPRNLSQRIK
jgi:hypothetical protein